MQQHPIPRNVTGFKFKLVGSMTLKQFGYLAVGVVLGYFFFKTLPLPGVISLGVGILFAGGGAALAFVPIQGRPLDTWVRAFIKSIYSPTQYVWHKQNEPPAILTGLKHHKVTGLTEKPSNRKTEQPKDIQDVEQKLATYMSKKKAEAHEVLDKKEKEKIAMAEKTMRGGTPTPHIPRQEKMEIELLSGNQATKKGFPSPTKQANIISGVVLDPQSKQLSGILVTVKNEKRALIRALKTNGLGQFALSAPLEDGVYYIEIEDPQTRFDFDIIKITLNSTVVKPIEVFAKTKKPAQGKMNVSPAKQDDIRQRLFS
jgi:hypothetical protein